MGPSFHCPVHCLVVLWRVNYHKHKGCVRRSQRISRCSISARELLCHHGMLSPLFGDDTSQHESDQERRDSAWRSTGFVMGCREKNILGCWGAVPKAGKGRALGMDGRWQHLLIPRFSQLWCLVCTSNNTSTHIPVVSPAAGWDLQSSRSWLTDTPFPPVFEPNRTLGWPWIWTRWQQWEAGFQEPAITIQVTKLSYWKNPHCVCVLH